MRVTIKGQVTIPQKLREKYGISANSEVDFVEEKGRIYLIKVKNTQRIRNNFRRLRGISSVKMTTEDILKLTRDSK